MRTSARYPDSLEGTGTLARYAQTLDAMGTLADSDLVDLAQKSGSFLSALGVWQQIVGGGHGETCLVFKRDFLRTASFLIVPPLC